MPKRMLFFARVLLLIILYGLINGEDGSQEKLVVRTINGFIRGTEDKSIDGKVFYTFKGIPFADPPVGKLRFLEPIEAEPWNGILEANKQADVCFQVNYMMGTIKGAEDCLYLNVYSPMPDKSEERLPVMIFIHGGAFNFGGSDIYKPHILLRERVILVVIQYRVGVLGFLSTEDDILPGNIGIKDQRMSMKWVQKNIGSFGGDPDKVTIFGNSAGGASVHTHVLSPGSAGLFHNAISQSGTTLCPWAKSSGHRKLAKKIGDHFNCPLLRDTKTFLECLQKVDVVSLLEFTSQENIFGLSPALWTPRADGDVLPEEPEVLLRKGRFNDVNFISGVTRDDGAMYFLEVFDSPARMEKLYGDFNQFGPVSMFLHNEKSPINLTVSVYDRYLKGSSRLTTDNLEEGVKLFSDRFFIMGHDFAALFHAQRGHTGTAFYAYELDHKGQNSLDYQLFPEFQEESKNWISHTAELYHQFILDGPFIPKKTTPISSEDLAITKMITKMWTDFARTGNPTPPGSRFTWEKATIYDFRHLSIMLSPKMEAYKRSEEMTFWASLNLTENKLMFPEGRINPALDVPRRTTTWLHYFAGSAFLPCLQRPLRYAA